MEKLKVGEDGISLSETDGATRYNNYQVFLDLKQLGYSDQRAASSMQLSASELDVLKKEFEGEEVV